MYIYVYTVDAIYIVDSNVSCYIHGGIVEFYVFTIALKQHLYGIVLYMGAIDTMGTMGISPYRRCDYDFNLHNYN